MDGCDVALQRLDCVHDTIGRALCIDARLSAIICSGVDHAAWWHRTLGEEPAHDRDQQRLGGGDRAARWPRWPRHSPSGLRRELERRVTPSLEEHGGERRPVERRPRALAGGSAPRVGAAGAVAPFLPSTRVVQTCAVTCHRSSTTYPSCPPSLEKHREHVQVRADQGHSSVGKLVARRVKAKSLCEAARGTANADRM